MWSTRTKKAGETLIMSVDFSSHLSGDELLSGTPVVAEIHTSALTIDNEAITEDERHIVGHVVALGKAVQFTVAGGTAGQSYRLKVTATTDDGQTLVKTATVRVT